MWAILNEQALAEQCVLVPSREATDEELLLVHTREHVQLVDNLELMTDDQCAVVAGKRCIIVVLHPVVYSSWITLS